MTPRESPRIRSLTWASSAEACECASPHPRIHAVPFSYVELNQFYCIFHGLAGSGVDFFEVPFIDFEDTGDFGFSIIGSPVVSQSLTASKTADDPDGNGSFTYAWQSFNGSSWDSIGTDASTYLLSDEEEGKEIRVVVSYTDGKRFVESITATPVTVGLVDDGEAAFSITGIPAVGETLTASLDTSDPDGDGSFSYSWQSFNGSSWDGIGNNASTYALTGAEEGKQVRVVVSYTDGQGFAEVVTAAPVDVGSTSILPTINLEVSPAALLENGAPHLIYTFSRTGATTAPLTIGYTVGGSATLGSDYTGIPAVGAIKSVTIPAGSSSALVTVNLNGDNTLEANETVALSLAVSSSYTIGTSTPVVGMILNDDGSPSITLAVAPSSVTEDGAENLIYTFERSSTTNAPLTVRYTVGGTATIGTDYTGVATAGNTKIVTFYAGASTATVIVNPTADAIAEADETVALTLANGPGYTRGTTTAVVGGRSSLTIFRPRSPWQFPPIRCWRMAPPI